MLSPRQCLHRLLTEHPAALDGGAGATWLNELIWREFYRHLMVYYPKLCKGRPFTAWTDKVAWRAGGRPAGLAARGDRFSDSRCRHAPAERHRLDA
ncbi:hypothetical protein LNP20_14210 [Klebsiella pneumoniae subsp. pneumoniae]|nr:hypothetical protein [Klebsiella pneumoniae subsp. pneumoniae]